MARAGRKCLPGFAIRHRRGIARREIAVVMVPSIVNIVNNEFSADRDSVLGFAIPSYVTGIDDRRRWENALRVANNLFSSETAVVWQTAHVLYHDRTTFKD